MVNLEWFRTFKAVYETGTLTSAANQLCISQPGASLHLDSLEAYIGYKLFDRGARKMVPTEQGMILYNSVVEGINKLEAAERNFCRKALKDKVCIRIGMCFEIFQLILEPYIGSLTFDLISKFGDYEQMLSDLDKGLLDLIITPYRDSSLNLEYRAFSREKIILVTGAGNDTADFQDLLEKKEYEACENYLMEQVWFGTTGDTEYIRNFWLQNFKKRAGFRPNYIVPNVSSIVRCISKPDQKGWAIIPDVLCHKQIEKGLLKVVWEGISPLENVLYFAQRKRSIYTEEITALEEIIKKEMKGIDNIYSD